MSGPRDPLARCAQPVFHMLLRLTRACEHGGDPSELHDQCCREVEQFDARAKELEVPSADAADARYALVALLDEVAAQNDGPVREFWLPRSLQMRFAGENVAGEGFFERLAAVRGDPKRRGVLRIYYLCLLFGFRGKYRVGGSELELLEIEEGLRRELERAHALPTELLLSPSGRRPREVLADARRNRLLLIIAAVSACASLLLYVGLRLSLLARTQQVIEQITGLLGV